MSKFKFKRLEIPDVILIEPTVFEDQRGFFLESYNLKEFEAFGINVNFVQDNHSRSKKGVIRGLHFQKGKMAQAKLVRVVKGEIFDVAVDIRKGSSYYGKWVAVTLSENNKRMLFIPEGFAHGFCVLSEEADVLYKASNFYSPEHEGGIRWDDPDLAIPWPVDNPIVSLKDRNLPFLSKI
ncbi:MAG: dTDP-4-dehydrorhamnose 3,5-epimerase [Candidatus Aminicenantes bacterium]|nr:dTDP-4-dehydrorhamnose 3,5-epimerase [Candidatus Aminicenantes bacterium]